MEKKPLGFWMTTSLVLGNMIGSGIFLLPASLALYGTISLAGWGITVLGAIALALIFSDLTKNNPSIGGPYVYCRQELGELLGFLVAWGYWIGVWVATAAIAVAFTSYLGYFFPILLDNPHAGALTTLCVLWIFTLINAYSIRLGGITQVLTTLLKIAPLMCIAICGLLKINPAHFTPVNLSDLSMPAATLTTASITLWAFIGLESATVPAESVRNPKTTIPRATLCGTLLAAVIYITSTIAVMGLVTPDALQHSNAPFAVAAAALWGSTGSLIIGGTAIISCLGAMNGWILIQGQIAYAIAQDQLFPKIFLRGAKGGSPRAAIVISSILSSIVVLMNYHKNLIQMFTFMILLSTLQTLIPYLFCSLSQLLMMIRQQREKTRKLQKIRVFLTLFAYTYTFFAIAGTGSETVYWSFILLLAGLPCYAWAQYHKTLKTLGQ
jgi:APA family basic amino acid/polyamine antiporter